MDDGVLKEFSKQFHEEISSNAEALDMLREHAFVEKAGEILEEYGEVLEFESCHWQARGMKVDGYAFDGDYANLNLVVSHWLDNPSPADANVVNSQLTPLFKRGLTFFKEALGGKLPDRIDVSNPAHDLAGLIYEVREDLLTVKIIVITDGATKERPAETEVVKGVEVKYVVWDIHRVCDFLKTGQREQIVIDFAADYGGPVPCVEQPSPGGKYVTYLAFVPGEVLADLYHDWKIRLLERNVRVFLSQRPKVNQGIRDTIRDEPDMFCAYNNGITVYAQNIELDREPGGCEYICRVEDFQIVNGGQTTASLYHTREKFKSDLSQVSVQMKLMIINEDTRLTDMSKGRRLADELVPRIGRFSNTQNRVQLADLLANDPPHPELHQISTNLSAPDPTGGSLVTFWFYEKSRGSFEETRRLQARTPAQQKKFDQKYPRRQRFDKSRFGKAWMAYRQQPHVVCLGAMKNFAHFNNWLQEQKSEEWQAFFRKTVSLVMLWNAAEKIVRRQKYGGYTHAIVSYTLAWLYKQTGMTIDLNRIWNKQSIDEPVLDAIEILSIQVNDHIRDTKLNVTEWCKKADCWNDLLQLKPPQLPDFGEALGVSKASASYTQQAESETADLTFCMDKGYEAWYELSKWLKVRDFMQGKQRSQCFNMGRTIQGGKKQPSRTLCYACRKVWEDSESGYGWAYSVDSHVE